MGVRESRPRTPSGYVTVRDITFVKKMTKNQHSLYRKCISTDTIGIIILKNQYFGMAFDHFSVYKVIFLTSASILVKPGQNPHS